MYFAPIISLHYCFLVNNVMESGECVQRITLTRNLGLFDKCYDCGLCKSLVE